MDTSYDKTESVGDRVQNTCLVILAVVATGFALYFLRPVLLPLLFALFLYLCLTPLIDFQMRRLRIPYGLALTSTTLLGGVVMLLIIGIAVTAMSRMSSDVSTYQAQFSLFMEWLSSLVPQEKLRGIDVTHYFRVSEATISGFLSSAVYGLSNLISNSVFVVILAVFILIGRGRTVRQGLLADLEAHVQTYIAGTMLLSLATGFMVGLTLAILGVRYALVFGLFAFLLNFIPLLGPIVATLLPLPIALLSPELSVLSKILAIVIPGLVQFVMGQIVSPRLIGKSLALHPVTVLLFLLFFQMIWGVGGAFMSTPIAAVLKILFDHFSSTRPLSDLMAGELSAFSKDRSEVIV
jgi:AI-2 transport protein TqsA